MSEAPHILVTGGAGFIGSHTVDALMNKGFRVSVLDNLSTGYVANLEQWAQHPRFNFVAGDITQDLTAAFAQIVKRFGSVERIAHFAALTAVPVSMDNPVDDIQVNIAGTARILEYARRNK